MTGDYEAVFIPSNGEICQLMIEKSLFMFHTTNEVHKIESSSFCNEKPNYHREQLIFMVILHASDFVTISMLTIVASPIRP